MLGPRKTSRIKITARVCAAEGPQPPASTWIDFSSDGRIKRITFVGRPASSIIAICLVSERAPNSIAHWPWAMSHCRICDFFYIYFVPLVGFGCDATACGSECCGKLDSIILIRSIRSVRRQWNRSSSASNGSIFLFHSLRQTQLNAIYVFLLNVSIHEHWTLKFAWGSQFQRIFSV